MFYCTSQAGNFPRQEGCFGLVHFDVLELGAIIEYVDLKSRVVDVLIDVAAFVVLERTKSLMIPGLI